MFYPCYNKCRNCTGPNKNNCLSCIKSESQKYLFLYKGECIPICPDGTFPEIVYGENEEEEQRYCNECYQNCKTCYGIGDHNNMKCESCNSSYIKNY